MKKKNQNVVDKWMLTVAIPNNSRKNSSFICIPAPFVNTLKMVLISEQVLIVYRLGPPVPFVISDIIVCYRLKL